MKKLIFYEWSIILLALLSLWPVIAGYHAGWYRFFLIFILLALIWVTRNRLMRTRQAAAEAQRKHDEITQQGTRIGR